MRRCDRAVTMIEIIVVLSALSLLIGILVPALGGARSSARVAACGVTQRNLHLAAMQWCIDNKDRLPGINSTGRKYLGNLTEREEMFYDTRPDMPVSAYDWVSPVIGNSFGLHANRARRTKQIFEDLGCPSTTAMNDRLYGTGSAHDSDDFVLLLETEGIGQISFLSPASFHLWGPMPNAPGRRYGWRGPVVTPRAYVPRLDRIGKQPADKVFLADGARYVLAGGKLDFDVDPVPDYFGSFLTSGPIYEGSTAYGKRPHSPDLSSERHETRSVYPRNRNLSYRHRGAINIMYFDGHLGDMTETESKTDAAPWYPSGSRFTARKATPESLTLHHEGQWLR